MLFPIGDDNSQRTIVPLVTYALIGINVLVYFLLQSSDAFTYGYSVVPAEITRGEDLDTIVRIGGQALRLYPGPSPIYLTLLTSMFMHGGIGHLFGNMLYLWIFGDNVEDSMGHVKYVIFYLLCGVLASLTHILFAPNSIVPSLGASGAIAGVLGAYLVLYPRQGIRVLYWGRIVEMPALMVIGFWGVLQFLSGFGSLARAGEGGGVAYMAHVGGFVAGMALIFLFRNRKVESEPRQYQ